MDRGLGGLKSAKSFARQKLTLKKICTRTVYQTYEEIERDCGSILNLKADTVVQKLTDHGMALQSARQCVNFLDEVDWHRAQLPLRQWLKRIQRFYHDKL